MIVLSLVFFLFLIFFLIMPLKRKSEYQKVPISLQEDIADHYLELESDERKKTPSMTELMVWAKTNHQLKEPFPNRTTVGRWISTRKKELETGIDRSKRQKARAKFPVC